MLQVIFKASLILGSKAPGAYQVEYLIVHHTLGKLWGATTVSITTLRVMALSITLKNATLLILALDTDMKSVTIGS